MSTIEDMLIEAAQLPALLTVLVDKGVFTADEWDRAITDAVARVRAALNN